MSSAKATSTNNETVKGKDTRKTVYFDDEKRSQFRELLLDLSKSRELQEHFAQISGRLETFYFSDDQKIKYHHYYADIFSTLTEIQNGDSKERTLEFLGSNLQYIRDNYKPIKNDIKLQIEKLYDHVNLEISRLNYSLTVKNETQSKIQALNTNLINSKNQYAELKDKNETIKAELKNSKIDNITVLGIFSTIVLGFVGTITFSASILDNINKAGAYKLLAIICIVALVFINFLWLLTSFLLHITDRKISLLNPVGIFSNILFVILFCIFISFTPEKEREYNYNAQTTEKHETIIKPAESE